jgi:hypothetical protein
MSNKMKVIKVTLSSGREVLLRELKIRDQEMAMRNCADKAGTNVILAATMGQKELLKLLIVQVDGKPVKGAETENLDDLFTYSEYMQLMQVLGKLTGADTQTDPKIEFATSGE